VKLGWQSVTTLSTGLGERLNPADIDISCILFTIMDGPRPVLVLCSKRAIASVRIYVTECDVDEWLLSTLSVPRDSIH